MISSLSGIVRAIEPDSITLEVGGIGLTIRPTAGALAGLRVGQKIVMPTHLIVREDELSLFGFADLDEKKTFEALQKVSGVGPRTALQAISHLGASRIQSAIAEQDAAVLVAAPGIGTKVAQRITLELKGLFTTGSLPALGSQTVVPADEWATVHAALINLGWSDREAREAVSAGRQDLSDVSDDELNRSEADEDRAGEKAVALRLRVALSNLNQR